MLNLQSRVTTTISVAVSYQGVLHFNQPILEHPHVAAVAHSQLQLRFWGLPVIAVLPAGPSPADLTPMDNRMTFRCYFLVLSHCGVLSIMMLFLFGGPKSWLSWLGVDHIW